MIGATPVQQIIREIHGKVDASGEVLVPTVGSPGATNDEDVLRIYDDLARLRSQVHKLEGNQ